MNETPRIPEPVTPQKTQLGEISNENVQETTDKIFQSNHSLFSPRKLKEKELTKGLDKSQQDSSNQDSLFVEDEIKFQGKASEKASSVSSNGINHKIEKAVYSIPKSLVKRNSFSIVALFFILCMALLISFVVYGEDILVLVQGNILILNLSASRLNEILFVHRFSELITLLRLNLIGNTRFEPVYGTQMQNSLPRNLYTEANYLRRLNGQFRNYLNQTDLDLFKEINSRKVKMVLEGSQDLELNNFDAVTELLMRAFTARQNPKIFLAEDTNVKFILDNILNDLLLATQSLNNIFIQDNEYNLDNLKLMPEAFLIVVLIIGASLNFFLIYQQKKFLKNRKDFIDIFLRLDEIEINSTLSRVDSFLVMLSQSHWNTDKLKTQNSIIKTNQQSKLQHKRIPKRETNLVNLNRNQFFISFLGFILYLIFVAPFFHAFFIVQTNISDIRNKVTILTTINNDLYQILLLSGSFYQYVRTDAKSLLRNNPINEEWEELLKSISESQGSLLNLLIYFQNEKTCSNSTIETLNHLIRGNLCTARGLSSFASLCPKLPAEILLSNGIQGLNSFSLSTLGTLKLRYDRSSRTFNDAKEILSQQDLINLDLMIATFQSYGYMSLQSTLLRCTIESLTEMKDNLIVVLQIYIPLYIILIPIILYFLLNKMELERVGWKKISRKIPLEIILTDKILKHHLIKESQFAKRV